MTNPFLIGTKIYLRPLEIVDAPQLLPWVNDRDVTRTLLIHRPMSLHGEEEFIAQVNKSEHDLALGMVLKATDALIGVAGLHRMDFKNRHALFGIFIGEKAAWDKGYGSEATALMVGYAFDTLNLNRVWLHVFADNPRGMRVYEKVGFKHEGVLRQESFRAGRYWDTVAMSILREEWDGGKLKAKS